MTLDPTRSLNGGATQPLTEHARRVLVQLAAGPVPRQKINPGVVDRLTRPPDLLAKIVNRTSPFAIHKGGSCAHLEITDAGRWEIDRSTGCALCLDAGYAATVHPGLHPGYGRVSERMIVGARCPKCGKVAKLEHAAVVPLEPR